MTAPTQQIITLLSNRNTSLSADTLPAARSARKSTHMHLHTSILSALFLSATVLGCTDVDIDAQITSGGCCSGGGCPETDSSAEDSATDTAAEDSGTSTTIEEPPCLCPEGYAVSPGGDECVTESIVEPTQSPTVYNVCESLYNDAYGVYGAIVEPTGTAPGGTKEANDFWSGRLNEVGVWACDPNSEVAGYKPINEWIGFSVCLDIAESGDYILGIAGDNRVSIDIDGSPVLTLDTDLVENFRQWHLLPIHLTSGVHILELRGKNDWSAAAFGAEISGPFVAGSLATDAAVLDEVAYAKNIVWSTGNLTPEQTFQLGESSGWQCPKEAALDLCAKKPVCVSSDHQACG